MIEHHRTEVIEPVVHEHTHRVIREVETEPLHHKDERVHVVHEPVVHHETVVRHEEPVHVEPVVVKESYHDRHTYAHHEPEDHPYVVHPHVEHHETPITIMHHDTHPELDHHYDHQHDVTPHPWIEHAIYEAVDLPDHHSYHEGDIDRHVDLEKFLKRHEETPLQDWEEKHGFDHDHVVVEQDVHHVHRDEY